MTRTSGANKRARVLVRFTTAALEAAYGKGWALGRRPAMLAMLTTLAAGDWRSIGTAALVTWNRPRTLTAKTRSHSSRLRLSSASGAVSMVVPALFTSTSRRPKVRR